jgi:(1->4)-alpha-D-glucan 1-alpha-D-glucosylmutase
MPRHSEGGTVRRPPLATYRLQLNLNFTFRDAAEVVPYLRALGVSDLYASPYLQARPGSLHGYDISDHNRLNPELEPEAHDSLVGRLRELGMGHLLDIVPNHMGIGESSNRWWMDVLENGPSSPFAPYFDIDWNPLKRELVGKVLLPVLGDQFGRVLERGELRLFFEEGRFRIAYFDHVFPVSPRSSSLVLRAILAQMAPAAEEDDPDVVELESVVTALEHLPTRNRTDPESVAERRRESFVSRRRLMTLHDGSPAFRAALDRAVEIYNGTPGNARSFDDLERVLDDQPYRLAYWRVAAEEINYRRFFDINDLAGVRVERGDVFEATHGLILQLLREGKVTGLRIDHPDGLFDPADYLRRLQEAATRSVGEGPVYLLVEKILTGNEALPEQWPVAGTVGYDFLTRLNALFVARENAAAMSAIYERFIGHRIHFGNLVYEKKKLILRVALASELNVLAYLLNRISENNRRFRDFTLGSLAEALRETIASFPVYRTYIDAVAGHVDPLDVEHLDRAIRTAIRRNRATSPTIFEFIRNILLLKWPRELEPAAREEHALFVMKFQQLTGPVMAKGVEDTSFYIYNRLVSLNEVGGEPDHFGIEPAELHGWLRRRYEEWPLAMNSSSTHDTKRSEDVRARINVLSEIPDEWERRVVRWAELNAPEKGEVDGEPVPDLNDEYLLYQTLVGAWPLEPPTGEARGVFRERIQGYMEKATREAKLHTSWINPNEGYDSALRDFVGRILDFDAGGPAGTFLADLDAFAAEVAAPGMVNSLAQTVVKLTAPGVPDVYQGQEIWDFSLVDPDNRRPVDYAIRTAMLQRIGERLPSGARWCRDPAGTRRRDDRSAAAEAGGEEGYGQLAGDLLDAWKDGRIKLLVTHLCLRLRQEYPELFLEGGYSPLAAEGSRADHLFAFARQHEGESILVVVPRLPATFVRETGRAVWDGSAWGDTRLLEVPKPADARWVRLFTGEEIHSGDPHTLLASEALDGFPVAVLVAR